MNKKMNVAGVTNELEQGSAFFRVTPPPLSHVEHQSARISRTDVGKPALSLVAENGRTNSIAQNVEQKSAQKVAQTFEQLSNPLTTEDIEALAFQLRKLQKVKVNAEVPVAWKERMDDLAYQLGVGKYELLMYIIGEYLGEIGTTRGVAQK
jgi:hypothetical protein